MNSSGKNSAADSVLPREFYLRDPETVARELLGAELVVPADGTRARIVETELYVEGDPASHSFRGPTVRNGAMFREGGILYVYRSYGIHACANVVIGPEGVGRAVLLRAAIPTAGLAKIASRRMGVEQKDWLRGPGRLCSGLGIDVVDDGTDLESGRIQIVRGTPAEETIGCSPRIGITKAVDQNWRFFFRDCAWVSGPRRLGLTGTTVSNRKAPRRRAPTSTRPD